MIVEHEWFLHDWILRHPKKLCIHGFSVRPCPETEVSCQPRVVHQMTNVAVGSPQKISDHMFRIGYGSIPISTIFRVMNIHLPAILRFTRGTRF